MSTRRRIFCYCILLLGACLSVRLHAQQPELTFRHINYEKGLSNSTIECIFQDSRGFMWFGTRDGLNRYDGYAMTVYKTQPLDTASISDNYIRDLLEDRNHDIWVATYNGLNRLNTATNRFTRFRHDPARKGSISSNQINRLYEDRKGQLWVGTAGGALNLFNPRDGSFTQFSKGSRGIGDDRVNCMLEDRKGNFWIGTESGLYSMDRENGSFYFYPNHTDPARFVPDNIIRSMQEDLQGNLWLATESSGLLCFNTSTHAFRKFDHRETDARSLSNNMVRAVLIDAKGSLWVGSVNGGLDLYDPATGSFYHYQNDLNNPTSLSQRTVSALLDDREGNLWVGTHRGGVNFYSPTAQKFQFYRQGSSPSTLSYSDVKAFCEDHLGRVWIGTDGGGLNLFDRERNAFRHYRHQTADPRSIGSDEVLHIMEDRSHRLWVGTWGGGLNLFDPASGSFTRFKNDPVNPYAISSDFVQKTVEDQDGHIWVATYYGGLNLFNPATRRFTRVIYDRHHQTQLTGKNIVSLEQDAAGNLWIGTDDGGLNRYDRKTGRFSHYFNKGEKLPDLRVLFFDRKGRLWIGQSGLWLFNPEQDNFASYTNKAGLDREFVKGITEDEAGNFWIATGNGITRFNPDNLSFKTYNTGDGLQGPEFEANAYLKTAAGEMFFGGVNGFNRFFPQNITGNRHAPPVYITDFQIFNRSMLPGADGSPLSQDISSTRQIRLTYRQSTISFTFTALNYTVPENNRYAYKLEHFNSDWIMAGPERKATYTNLDPGEYIFRVRAANNDGVWNDKGAYVKIVITPPFWSTWWFRILCLALALATTYLVLSNRRKTELRQLEASKREELNQLQLQFFTNISHEFRTPLSLITGPLEKLMKEERNDHPQHYFRIMHKNAQRLLNLINELMDFRKVEEGILQLKVMPGSLGLFLQEIAEEFTEAAMQKHIRFETQGLDRQEEVWFDRQVLEKIILNLLNNSFKYTAAEGRVCIGLLSSLDDFKPQYRNELVIRNGYRGRTYRYIRVWDNGIGISKDSIEHLFERYYRVNDGHLGSGIGLAFVKSLTTLHKGDIYVYSERKEGTEIIIGLPVDRADYTPAECWMESGRGSIRLESMDSGVLALPGHPAQPAPAAGSYHILVVDDNDELRSFLHESLGDRYTVSEARNGQGGLEKVREEMPDLIISDVMMPVMNGMDLCRAVKSDPATSHIPFIMLTARTAQASSIEGMGSGADYYFAKPLSIDLLQLTVRNLFIQKEKLRDRVVQDAYSEAKEHVHSLKDKEFMEQLVGIIDSQLVNPDLDIDFLCSHLGMSRTKLYQRIRSITGQPVGEFIRSIRLRKAAYIMTHEDVPLSEIIYRIGIQTQSYFTKAFKKEFGKTPTQFMQELQREQGE